MATATKEVERGASGKFECACGRKFEHAAWYTKHALKCDGTPVKTEGAIAARGGGASAKRPARTDPPRGETRARTSVKRRRKIVRARRSTGAVTRRQQKVEKGAASPVMPVSPASFIAACRAEIAKLERAIAAAEALA